MSGWISIRGGSQWSVLAGFYIGADLDPSAGASVVTDSIPRSCATLYNVWNDSIALVSTCCSNDYLRFSRARLHCRRRLYGGSSSQPPVAQFSASSTQICAGWRRRLH